MKKLIIALVLILSTQLLICNDLRTITNLNGKWKFNLGDDMKWADPKFDDKDWDLIKVPAAWEKEGYVGYDGYAWYRRTVSIPEMDNSKTLYLIIRNVDDVDEVFFNGQKIGSTGNMPPQYSTAYNWERKYIIPSNLVKPDENLIAVRVYDEGQDGGMTWEGVKICIDENEENLDLNLSGDWKFKLYDNKLWKTNDFDDTGWKTLKVPLSWESQGYYDYDGNAWYRKTFDMPQALMHKKLFLCLGKVDDYDKVFFNGQLIGEVSPSKDKSEFKVSRLGEYNTRRVYEIPEKLIKDGKNLIAIKVYDMGGVGGIYDGPVGIMTEKNLKAYKEKPEPEYYYNEFDWGIGSLISDIINDIFN